MTEKNEISPSRDELIRMSVDVVAAYVSENTVDAQQIPALLESVFGTLNTLGSGSDASQDAQKPAVAIKRSVTPEYLICLEDGKKLKMLKRHLRTNYDMTPEEYRAKWGLPPDYPMVAPAYAAQRSDFAKKIGLGKKASRGKKG